MTLSIDPLTHIISVPKADMLLVQSSPIEIRELNINTFRLNLKDWEDSAEGMTQPKTHDHNTTVTVSGVQLARVVKILAPYTITFEDGNYAVNLVGANSNIGDRVNLNKVSIRATNSAGLIQTREIEYASFNGYVTIDIVNGVSGTDYPKGTPSLPVNNLADAVFIANLRGFTELYITESMTIDGGIDLTDFTITGRSQVGTTLFIDTSAITTSLTLRNANIVGILDGNTQIIDCMVGDLSYVNGHIHHSGLYGTMYLDGNKDAVIANCYTVDQDNSPAVDMGGSGQDLSMPNYSGVITISNLNSDTDEIGIGLLGGEVILDATISAGSIIISGSGLLVDNTTGTATVNSKSLMNTDLITGGLTTDEHNKLFDNLTQNKFIALK